MIRPFHTDKHLQSINSIIGVLTPAGEMHQGTTGVIAETRHYILAICDWCGTREIIDDPDPDVKTGRVAYLIAMHIALNWIDGYSDDEQDYCSRRCREDHSGAVKKRYMS